MISKSHPKRVRCAGSPISTLLLIILFLVSIDNYNLLIEFYSTLTNKLFTL